MLQFKTIVLTPELYRNNAVYNHMNLLESRYEDNVCVLEKNVKIENFVVESCDGEPVIRVATASDTVNGKVPFVVCDAIGFTETEEGKRAYAQMSHMQHTNAYREMHITLNKKEAIIFVSDEDVNEAYHWLHKRGLVRRIVEGDWNEFKKELSSRGNLYSHNSHLY